MPKVPLHWGSIQRDSRTFFLPLKIEVVKFYCSKRCLETHMRSLKPFQFSYYDYIADNSLVALNTHQPNLHFIVFMLTQSFNQKKKCEKWKRFSIKGFGVKFPPKSGCQVLLSKNIELQPSRLTTQTSAKYRSQQKQKRVVNCRIQSANKNLNSPGLVRFFKKDWKCFLGSYRAENGPKMRDMDKKS